MHHHARRRRSRCRALAGRRAGRDTGWTEVGAGSSAAARAPAAGDVIGWYELRIGATLATDRPITRLHVSDRYIASFNLLGQGRLNQACGELLHRRLVDDGIAAGETFDLIVCSESKAVGMAQVVTECFGQDRYVVLRKGVKNYMPRRPREPLVQEAVSTPPRGPSRSCWTRSTGRCSRIGARCCSTM